MNNELKNDKERSKEAFDKLDPCKVKIAVTLGDAICKELGMVYTKRQEERGE
jgi:hypothetical protein